MELDRITLKNGLSVRIDDTGVHLEDTNGNPAVVASPAQINGAIEEIEEFHGCVVRAKCLRIWGKRAQEASRLELLAAIGFLMGERYSISAAGMGAPSCDAKQEKGTP